MTLFKPKLEQLKDRMGRGLRNSLILELSYSDAKHCIYTLKDDDHIHKGKKYYSLKKLYMELAIPDNEYEFAVHCFANWKTWKILSTTSIRYQQTGEWLDVLEDWREELTIKWKAMGVRALANRVGDDKGMQAEKWLAEGGFLDKRKGRPSKQDKQKELDIHMRVQEEVSDDLQRLLN